MKIIAYLKSTTRLATALFLAACAFALVIGVGSAAYHYWEKSQAEGYESIKTWSADLQANLQFSLVARTKLVDERFFIKVRTDAYPPYLKDPRFSRRNPDEVILLNFVDKDGFKVFSQSIPITSFSTTVDAAGKPIGLDFEADEYMSVQKYASMAKLEVQWTVDTAGPSVTKATAAPIEELDHCAPNLAKAERLRRLAQHGAVRQTGDGSYAVGYRTLTFFSHDNSLLDCR